MAQMKFCVGLHKKTLDPLDCSERIVKNVIKLEHQLGVAFSSWALTDWQMSGAISDIC